DHDLWSATGRAGNELNLVLRQAIASTKPATGIACYVQQRSAGTKINESSRHVPVPRRSDWPSTTPLRDLGVLRPPSALPSSRLSQVQLPFRPGWPHVPSDSGSDRSPRALPLSASTPAAPPSEGAPDCEGATVQGRKRRSRRAFREQSPCRSKGSDPPAPAVR